MYWRVRKINPEEILKTYAVHILLVISLLFNGFLMITRPKTSKVNEQTKTDMASFAKEVTRHLLDTSYISYSDATNSILKEFHQPALQQLRAMGVLPTSVEDHNANQYEYNKTKRVCAIKFSSVTVQEPDSNGFVPVDVYGTVAVHSSAEAAQHPFHMRYLMALRQTDPPTPVVVNVLELPSEQ